MLSGRETGVAAGTWSVTRFVSLLCGEDDRLNEMALVFLPSKVLTPPAWAGNATTAAVTAAMVSNGRW
jgi:hypothetical protein